MRYFTPAALALGLALGAPAVAADCDSYALFHQGTTMTVTTSNAKGKETGRTVTTTRAATSQRAEVHADITDEKGKHASTVDYVVTCANGTLSIDMNAYLPKEQLEAYKDYEMSVKATALEYPVALAAGQALGDGTIAVKFTMKDAPPGFPMGTTTMDIALTDRKVVGAESVTTPAGTFQTWKIEYDSTTRMGGMIPMSFEMHIIEWYAPGLGTVKSESAKGGKPMGSTLLTALKR